MQEAFEGAPSSMLNVTALRSEALERLRQEGYKPFTPIEGAYIGLLIYDALEDDEHPLLQAAEFEIDDLKTGKWEWLFAWLSPCHMMAEYPTVMIEIAQFLTGRKPIPAQIRKELKQRLLGQ